MTTQSSELSFSIHYPVIYERCPETTFEQQFCETMFTKCDFHIGLTKNFKNINFSENINITASLVDL